MLISVGPKIIFSGFKIQPIKWCRSHHNRKVLLVITLAPRGAVINGDDGTRLMDPFQTPEMDLTLG